jgi:hypothetical protein
MVSNVTKKTSPLQLLEIRFVLKRGDKVKVYRGLVRIIANGSLAVSKRELARFFAKHTNFANNPEIKKTRKRHLPFSKFLQNM